MANGRIAVKTFGIVQGGILLAIIVAIFIYRKRHQENLSVSELRLDGVDIRAAIKRTPTAQTQKNDGDSDRGQEAESLQIGSALPAWSAKTPAHEILGVSPHANSKEIEAAYRKLLKRYHPDRFASWGKGYQNRAHHTVLLIQAARDQMLGKKN